MDKKGPIFFPCQKTDEKVSRQSYHELSDTEHTTITFSRLKSTFVRLSKHWRKQADSAGLISLVALVDEAL